MRSPEAVLCANATKAAIKGVRRLIADGKTIKDKGGAGQGVQRGLLGCEWLDVMLLKATNYYKAMCAPHKHLSHVSCCIMSCWSF